MMTSNDTVTVLLCGVGGQGTILAADLLAHAALESGYDAKVSEIHGMSQRGGNVVSHVRMGDAGEEVFAPLLAEGTADLPHVSFLGIDSPADAVSEGGR